MALNGTGTVSTRRINSLIRLTLPLALVIVFLFTLNGAIHFYMGRSAWNIGDWLINFHGGFVRRGLFGESVLWVAHMLAVNPGAIVVGIQCAAYAVFFLFSWLLLRRQATLVPYVFLIASPFIFLFHLFDPIGGYRKEILFFAVMAYLVWQARRPNKRVFERAFFGVLAGYPVLILSHEMLAIWLPYLLIIYFYTVPLSKTRVLWLVAVSGLSVIAFIASMVAAGDATLAETVNLSLQKYGYYDPYGAAAFLKVGGYKALVSTWTTALDGQYFIYYPQVVFLCALAFIPVRKNLAMVLASPLAKALVAVSLVGTVLISLVGIDWGRFIYASYMPLFLLTLLVDSPAGAPHYSIRAVGLWALALIFYAGAWYVPHSTLAFPYRWPF